MTNQAEVGYWQSLSDEWKASGESQKKFCQRKGKRAIRLPRFFLMIKLGSELKVYLSSDPTDMRKSINGLAAIVANDLEQTPGNGHVFVFCNRARNKVKCLYWDKNGFVLHYKKLDRGRFKFNRCEISGVIEISHDQLSWLLSGLDFMLMNQFPDNNYAHYF